MRHWLAIALEDRWLVVLAMYGSDELIDMGHAGSSPWIWKRVGDAAASESTASELSRSYDKTTSTESLGTCSINGDNAACSFVHPSLADFSFSLRTLQTWALRRRLLLHYSNTKVDPTSSYWWILFSISCPQPLTTSQTQAHTHVANALVCGMCSASPTFRGTTIGAGKLTLNPSTAPHKRQTFPKKFAD